MFGITLIGGRHGHIGVLTNDEPVMTFNFLTYYITFYICFGLLAKLKTLYGH